MSRVNKIAFPVESRLQSELPGAQFRDAFEAELHDITLTPAQICLAMMRATPRWVEWLMAIRNRLVRMVGLKDVGRLGAADRQPATTYAVGDRLGIFQVFSTSAAELVLGIDDRHLDVRVSFLKRVYGDRGTYVVASLVKMHNALGHIYMIPVGRIYPIVVQVGMRAAEV